MLGLCTVWCSTRRQHVEHANTCTRTHTHTNIHTLTSWYAHMYGIIHSNVPKKIHKFTLDVAKTIIPWPWPWPSHRHLNIKHDIWSRSRPWSGHGHGHGHGLNTIWEIKIAGKLDHPNSQIYGYMWVITWWLLTSTAFGNIKICMHAMSCLCSLSISIIKWLSFGQKQNRRTQTYVSFSGLKMADKTPKLEMDPCFLFGRPVQNCRVPKNRTLFRMVQQSFSQRVRMQYKSKRHLFIFPVWQHTRLYIDNKRNAHWPSLLPQISRHQRRPHLFQAFFVSKFSVRQNLSYLLSEKLKKMMFQNEDQKVMVLGLGQRSR